MTIFNLVYKEFIESGFTDLEAIGAAEVIAKIPDADRLWNLPESRRMIMDVAIKGVEPLNEQQKALVDGISALTDKERQCYYMYVFEKLSIVEIGRMLGISFNAVYDRLENARGKLAAAKNGELDWKNDKRVNRVLDEIPEKRKLCFLLRYRKGLTVPQIAGKLDISTATVKDSIKKAKGQIHCAVLKIS